jgi:hypothetical protein
MNIFSIRDILIRPQLEYSDLPADRYKVNRGPRSELLESGTLPYPGCQIPNPISNIGYFRRTIHWFGKTESLTRRIFLRCFEITLLII